MLLWHLWGRWRYIWWRRRDKWSACKIHNMSWWKATTPDKTSWDKPKTHAYFFLTWIGNTIIAAEMLSFPSPLIQCCLEGLTVHQTCFAAAKQHWYGGEGENCNNNNNNYHRENCMSIRIVSTVSSEVVYRGFSRDCRIRFVSQSPRACFICISSSCISSSQIYCNLCGNKKIERKSKQVY